MLNVYRCLSENISQATADHGSVVTKQPLVRAMRTVKTEALRLISTWVGKSNDPKMVCDNFIPPLLDAVLGDYQRNVPTAREPEVLSTMATFVNKLEVSIAILVYLPKPLLLIKPKQMCSKFVFLYCIYDHCGCRKNLLVIIVNYILD